MSSVIFDVDGVLIDTPHERAWRQALEVLMAGDWRSIAPLTTYTPERFTTAVYQKYVAGKPRSDGAIAVLEYFGVPDAEHRAVDYAERKQLMIDELLGRGEFAAFPDALPGGPATDGGIDISARATLRARRPGPRWPVRPMTVARAAGRCLSAPEKPACSPRKLLVVK